MDRTRGMATYWRVSFAVSLLAGACASEAGIEVDSLAMALDDKDRVAESNRDHGKHVDDEDAQAEDDMKKGKRNAVVPVLDCVDQLSDGQFRAHWGYRSDNKDNVRRKIGKKNRFIPTPDDRGQPTKFNRGTFNDVFTVKFPANKSLTWFLDGNSVIANGSSKRCDGNIAGSGGVGGAAGKAGAGAGGVGAAGRSGSGGAGAGGGAGSAGAAGKAGAGGAGGSGNVGGTGVAGGSGVGGSSGSAAGRSGAGAGGVAAGSGAGAGAGGVAAGSGAGAGAGGAAAGSGGSVGGTGGVGGGNPACDRCESTGMGTNNCPTALANCNNLTGVTSGAVQPGQSKALLCRQILDCIHTSHCAQNFNDTDCLCGTDVPAGECFAGTFDAMHGPCRDLMAAGAETNIPAQLSLRFSDAQYAIGAAITLVENCDYVECNMCL